MFSFLLISSILFQLHFTSPSLEPPDYAKGLMQQDHCWGQTDSKFGSEIQLKPDLNTIPVSLTTNGSKFLECTVPDNNGISKCTVKAGGKWKWMLNVRHVH